MFDTEIATAQLSRPIIAIKQQKRQQQPFHSK